MHKRNKSQIDNAKDIDVVTPMHNLIEYSDNYSKTSGSLWQSYRDEPVLKNDVITVFFGNSASFEFKQKIIGEVGDDGRKDVKTMVSIKYLNHFWKTLEMLLINCECNLIQIVFYLSSVISNAAANQATTFVITDAKLYVSVVTLSTDDNGKLS